MLMRYHGGPETSISIHVYSIWIAIYRVVYSPAILTSPPKQRRRKKILHRYGRDRWAGKLAPVPV